MAVSEKAKYEEALHKQREQRKKNKPKAPLVKVDLYTDIVVEHKFDDSVLLYSRECFLQPTLKGQHVALRGRLALVRSGNAPYEYQR